MALTFFKDKLNIRLLLMAVALLIGVAGFFFGERTTIFGSLGDEKYYYLIANDFNGAVLGQGLDDYRLQRIVPPGVVHYSLQIFSLPPTAQNVINGFGVCNIILLIVGAYVWSLIAGELKLSLRGVWLGFVALFCNYHVLKYIPYIQVSTDLFAFTITLSLVYFFLKKNIWGLGILTVLGAFVWPTIVYTGALLLIFSNLKPVEQDKRAPYCLNFILAAGVVIFACLHFEVLLKAMESGRLFSLGVFSMGANRPLMPAIYVSIALVLLYLFVTLGGLLNSGRLFNHRYWLSFFNWKGAVMAVAVLFSVKLIIYFLANGHNARPVDYLIKNLLIVSTIQPGVFLVNHVVYFGPVLIFLLFLWESFCRIVRSYGPGLVLCMVLVVFFSLDSESRKQMNTYPLVIPFLIKATEGMNWPRLYYWLTAAVAFVFSKFWFKIHTQPWGGSPVEFPAQRYYMNMGAWMSHSMYFLQGGCVLVVVLMVYFFMFHNKKFDSPEMGV